MQNFKNYITPFADLLSNVQTATISTNNYATSYLQDLIAHKKHYLNIYAVVLEKAFTNINYTQATLLDFGTGNGLLALFAKFCGVQKVFASDLSKDFLNAAQQLSKQMNIVIDGWILGNENILQQHLSTTKIDVVVGTDVIEHIYNLNHFFGELKKLNPKIVSVFTTASVAENFFKSRKLKALQIKDELEDSNAFQASYQNEFAGLSFLEIRKRIIKVSHPALAENKINQLAKATRGLIKNDIETAVKIYVETNQMPQPILHLTNTCDPITGSWTERLLTVKEYQSIYNNNKTQLLVYNGFYNSSETGAKALLAKGLNKIIAIVGKQAISISPFIILKGEN